MNKFVSSRAARVQLDKTSAVVSSQVDLLLRMGTTVNDHAEHIQAIEDERARLKGLRARLRWIFTGR